MYPHLHIGPVTLQTFGIMFALAFLGAGALVYKRLAELGKPTDWAYECLFSALLGGLVGSRLYYIATNYDSVRHDLVGNLFSGSGLVWYGGAIGGAIAVGIWARLRGMFNAALLDLCAAPLAVGYAVGRIGCQVSGDGDYGKAWNGTWAMAYPHGTKPIDTPVQPTPIYETLAMGLVAYLLWRLRDRFQPGILFAIYLVLAGTERFLVEFIRRNDHVLLGLTIPQLTSIVMIIAGATWIGVKSSQGSLARVPA